MNFRSHPDTCFCCEGIEILTPLQIAQRPGLPALSYRVGTHATFLETMLARLSSLYLEVDDNGLPLPWGGGRSGCGRPEEVMQANPCAPSDRPRLYPLRDLSIRNPNDAAIALLDVWALVADVLTFYQARIANEGYLRTAIERRSVQELARLVGYKLRPGVAASVYLAFELDKGYQVDIPAGTRAQSIPQAAEMPQPFETSEALRGRDVWNAIPARTQRPQYIALNNVYEIDKVFLEGLSTQLRPNDPLLFVFGEGQGQQAARFVKSIEPVTVIEPIPGAGYTIVELQPEAELLYAQLVAARYLDLEKFEVRRETQTAMNLIPHLEKLSRVHSRSALARELPQALKLAAVRPLRAGSKLIDWLESLETDLKPLSAHLEEILASAPPLADNKSRFPFLVQAAAQAKEPVRRFASSHDLPRKMTSILSQNADIVPRMLTTLKPRMAKTFYAAWGSAQTTPVSQLQQVDALRVKAAPFGHNAGPMSILDNAGVLVGETEWPLGERVAFHVVLPFGRVGTPGFTEAPDAASGQGRAKITLETGGKTFGGFIDLSQGAVLEFPDGRVTVEIVDDATYRFTFELDSQNITRVIQFKRNENQISVSVDDSVEVDLAVSQTKVVEIDHGHRLTAILSQSGVGVIDENLTSPAQPDVLTLDAAYEQIQPDSWVLIDRLNWSQPRAFQVEQVDTISESKYRLSGRVTRLVLSGNWLTADDLLLSDIRRTTVYAQSETLPLVDERYDEPVQDDTIELDGLYDGLESGRWIFVAGERIDIPGARGIRDVELAMIANVTQGVQMVPVSKGSTIKIPRPNDKVHTTLELAQPLDYIYERRTVKVYANVAKATHGETHREILGSGDARKAFQSFTLRQNPLTYLPAPVPSGAASTLDVRVNEVRWPEIEGLYFLGERDRGYELRRDDVGNKDLSTVVFGDGWHGARLPTGIENIEGLYRSGIGKVGNVAAESIKNLIVRPLGVKSVNNPQRASGGADRDDRDSARRNAPLAVMALDRLVSAQDYEDFARMFAGIGKAAAKVFPQGRGKLVHVTIAGASNIPIDVNSDLYRNLTLALQRYGDPSQPFELDLRELLLIIMSAKVRLLPDYRWESLEPQIRSALLDTFGFERRELGQDVYGSEIIAAIQGVPGLAFVDLDYLDSLSESEAMNEIQLAAKLPTVLPARPEKGIDVQYARPGEGFDILPAQMAIFSPEIPDTLLLTELT
jgi:hypothetical protein